MGTATNSSANEMMEEMTVIDTDFHLHIPDSAIYEYIDDGEVREKVEEFGTPGWPSMGWSMSYATEVDFSGHERPQGAALDRNEIQQVMDDFDLDTAIVVPGTHLPLMGSRYPEITTELIRAYNDYVIDNVIDIENGIYASLVVPKDDPEQAVAELDRVGDELGFVAAQNWFNASRLWGDVQYDPLFEALIERDLPLMLHVDGVARARYDLVEDSMQTYAELMTTNVVHQVTANVTNMIMTGVFEKYPDLEVVIQEAGTNWIPYVANRADEFYQIGPEDVSLLERMREQDIEYLSQLPSEYLFDNIYVTTQPIALPSQTDRARGLLKASRAEEMFLFATDWPHHTLDLPEWLLTSRAVEDDERERIFHSNAEDLFQFPK